ncbi:tRNA (adenosine(37)-N6)-threonylcarbamoyltransferase complex transferase subunit TsaD [Marinococcus halophilus]|uniref:tRNA N6-adenosine threonylcarbamoyltransferase n=1 Tax=Marinococcus halophilus TaxID=1371 RepID=A0A510YA51_MARHA|nr:tRNA (adenosine(37)-N6)-threonylcarbamoyltransferase complex transferase subunit TsaD [Marinococcus halophilus]OZT78792.1 tRNA (adenosine(37)-N6)-threonylcarbamoyltransferase complex transferase subunit TsaD [Marinococcus halophilus]GEK60240.1 tRNA N6-adenosine threonylcarbamoyltransferase [Marinococcus halophilus]
MNEHEPIDILAVETSCDETAAAVIRNGTEILSNVVLSQMKSHKRFGGVVPEVASRHHAESITQVMEQALEEADSTFSDLSAVAVTEGPGLVGALLVGVNAAKATAYAKGLPLIGVHHIAGHIQATRLEAEWEYPALALVVSGGHTELVLIREEGQYELLGQTRDDAVGEAYDKVARTLGLPYPGGPELDKLAKTGDPSVPLPVAWLEEGSYDFSFSGLKSAVMNTLHNARQRGEEWAPEDVAASFQQSVITVLTEKTARAAAACEAKQVMVVGGVAANSGLRAAMKEKFEESGVKLQIPPLHLCTDNAAMIGAAAYINWKKGNFSSMDLNGVPGLPLHM